MLFLVHLYVLFLRNVLKPKVLSARHLEPPPCGCESSVLIIHIFFKAGGEFSEYGGIYRGSVSPARMYGGDADSGRGSIETDAHHNHHSQLQRATTLLSPQLIGRPPSASISSRSHHAASESDDSSLNSTDEVVLTRRSGPPIPSPIPSSGYSATRGDYFEASQFHNVISGSVTTVPIEGQSASAIQVRSC